MACGSNLLRAARPRPTGSGLPPPDLLPANPACSWDLHAPHKQGHRPPRIKPGNLLVSCACLDGPERLRTTGWRVSPAVKIVDPGLAALQQANDASSFSGETGHVVGMPRYYILLPEQARDVKAADARNEPAEPRLQAPFRSGWPGSLRRSLLQLSEGAAAPELDVPRRSTSFGPTRRY